MLEKLTRKQKSILLTSILCFAIYFNVIFGDFVTDDFGNVVNNEKIHSLSNLPEIFTSPFWTFSEGSSNYYTPLTSVSLALDYALWGLNPGGFHFTNIIIHVINSVLVFLLVDKLVENKKIPLVSALLFATFPVSVDSVAWISGRTHMLALMFSLISVLSFIKYRERDKKMFYIASLSSFVLALLSKETALFLPLFIILYDYLYKKGRSEAFLKNLKRNSVLYSGFIIVLAAYAVLTIAIVGNVLPQPHDVHPYPTNPLFGKGFLPALINTPLLVFYYALMLLTNVIFDFPPLLIDSLLNPVWILLSVPLLAAILYITKIRKRYGFVAFFSVWFFANIIPAVVAIPSYTTYVVNRFSYIPSVGIAVLLPTAVLYFARKKRLKLEFCFAVFVFIIIMYSGVSFAKTFEWRNEEALFMSMIRNNPNNYFAYNQLANYYMNGDVLTGAEKYFEKSLEIEPEYTETLNGLGSVYFSQGRFGEAIDVFERALEIEQSTHIMNNLGNSYVMVGRYDDAMRIYNKAIELNATEAHASLGALYCLIGFYENATEEYQTAISLKPGDIGARNGLAFCYLEGGSYEKAIQEFMGITEIDPRNADAWFNIGVTYLNGFDDKEMAEYYIRKALEIKPDEMDYLNALEKIS
jgi:tetratricopeptide (TPR) repeat protein